MASRSSSSRQAKPESDTIGNFIIDQEIGKGSFAQVYSGRHKVTGAIVAVKSVELARLNKKLKENLYGEIKILKDLRHPHIVALHDCVESTTHINLIMEYCELGDLSLFIKKREKLITNPATHDLARKYPNAPGSGLNEVVIRHFLKQLASALKFLRAGNFVHRDVKPQNLLLLPSPLFRQSNASVKQILSASHDSLTPAAGLPSLPMLKLADFGFARVLPSTSLAETLCGSPLYMAPEILRYERYDAKADLWSVGTVLFEMVTGRPPFRASNHVELLRRIEAADDVIKFPKESILSSDLKHLIRALLKRLPVERVSFENFFTNRVVTDPIPGLVEDDIPKEERRISREIRAAMKSEEAAPVARRQSFRRYGTDQDASTAQQVSPRPLRSSPLATPIEPRANPMEQVHAGRMSYSPRQEAAEGLGIRRPIPQPSTSAPTRAMLHTERRRGYSNASAKTPVREAASPTSSQPETRFARAEGRAASAERERAAQDVAFERDYVVVEKKQVEVNAFADQLALYPPSNSLPKSGAMVRRATQQGVPTSTTGAIPTPPSRNLQIAQGRTDQYRKGSYDRMLAGSPSSTTSAISKAIQDASLRLFGFKYTPPRLGRGHSPPQMYSAFPAYPTPSGPAGLIGDGKQSAPAGEESRVAQCIEDYATRSDVVYGFAEVKFKQLIPVAPSAEQLLGGMPAEELGAEEEEGLTVEAVVALSEEALVLYVKSLSLLAKSMDIASLWWSRKNNSGLPASVHGANLPLRINSAVQWVRGRFNEVLEKAEVVKLKLVEAQQRLPEDHPSHPSNNQVESALMNASSAVGPVLSEGLSAEKLMYDRALEMGRTAAINEVANEDLQGCKLSYITAIRMLEAVLDNDSDIAKRRVSGSGKDDDAVPENSHDINAEDQQSVQKVIQMLSSRLTLVSKKIHMIEAASKAHEQQQSMARRRSGDMTPRSVPT